ncbi:MAG: gamma-glutamyl-gamma-aminobutyrate hydrolase family protein [Verrucomicrobiota bacterium]|nr:gamma-glutamyl-gamma-aminobutyrate hydrolase family protein [Verrucomicrobiota bacterium]
MKEIPLILVSPSTQRQGREFSDASISLSNRYTEAIMAAGGAPLIVPCTASKKLIAEYVRRSDGVLLTGGDDVQPKLYARNLSDKLAKTVGELEPERDVLELQMIAEIFRQRKPLLAICRGHQILNVALGGDLIVDIPSEVPQAINHRRTDLKSEPVHEVQLEKNSLSAKIFAGETIRVNSTHHQAVGKIASSLRVIGKSDDGIIEVMELKDKKLLPYLVSVQFHPERLYDRYQQFAKLFKSFIRACGLNRKKL